MNPMMAPTTTTPSDTPTAMPTLVAVLIPVEDEADDWAGDDPEAEDCVEEDVWDAVDLEFESDPETEENPVYVGTAELSMKLYPLTWTAFTR
jgi:hypothetical protein